jgi:phosphatidylserine synthase 2
MHIEELNAFFLKHILWVPPECKLNVVRLLVWAFVGVPSLRQIYSYMTDVNCKRIGHQTFLALLILITELIVIIKFGQGEFPDPMPNNVRWGLGVFLTGYVSILIGLMLRTRSSSGKEEAKNNNSNVQVSEAN